MSADRPLRGGCSCGRNKYTVTVPQNASERAQVFFDNSAAHRRSQATPLSAWLRIPLAWYESSTYAYFDDESHNSIRRCYTSPQEQNAKRFFCGFCGTPLSYWFESADTDEADYISLTLGSLAGSDLRDLEELGLLPREALEEAEFDREKVEKAVPTVTANRDLGESLPWFETMVEGSKLGKMKREGGRRTSVNGQWRVEWEIVEWTADDGETGNMSPGKRKFGVVEESETPMDVGH
ncbi:hypothetical protein BJ875DRAFT_376395 [Amylocarpus encephaloides]|uniref:CENP-V/GFA domain-containing protein n=1 Tax=Amylocarpus encephaloides TaxID=45428 RepID=A0A9P7YIJ0_9HELO|nr:hypothetical protein BJ875DRAFT_376395 [Amylocarpus encephaloides]